MFAANFRSNTPESADYWRDQYEQERQARERQQAQAEKDRKERREERSREVQQSYRTASDWPEAFRKQRNLYGQELRECERDARAYPDDEGVAKSLIPLWQKSLAVIDRAEALWKEGEEEIRRLEAALREKVAAAIEADDESLAEYLRDDDPSGWLDW